MTTNKYFIIFLLTLLLPFFGCNETENEDNLNENESEYPENHKNNNITNFDELDRKMRELMNEKDFAEVAEGKDIKVISSLGAEKVDVELKIGAGKLRLTGGASELLIAGFIYTNESWKPEIRYKLQDKKGELIIEQPDNNDFTISDEDKYVWNLKFNNSIPLDFDIELGAGISDIVLSDLNIDDFSMVMGIGKSEIDLRGKWKKSTTIHLVGGIGLSKIYLPQDIGVRLNVDKGIGGIDFSGLIQKSRNQYVNKLYETSEITLTVNLKTGIGKIEIE